MKRFHNKRRNSALLYEFLVRHISKCLLEGKKEEADKAMFLSKKYFSIDSPLKEELTLFKIFETTKVKSVDSARKILETVYSASKKINSRKIDEYKSKLIKEINYTFNDENFYNAKVPNYTFLASLQTLLNEARFKKSVIDEVKKIQLEDYIVGFLMKETPKKGGEELIVNPQYNAAVYKFVVNRFHQKYDGKLNESQKKLLMKFISFQISGKDKDLKEFLKKEVVSVGEKIKLIKEETLLKDSDLMKKLKECRERLLGLNFDAIDDSKIFEVLQYLKLVEEIES
jgi:hypothetical protein